MQPPNIVIIMFVYYFNFNNRVCDGANNYVWNRAQENLVPLTIVKLQNTPSEVMVANGFFIEERYNLNGRNINFVDTEGQVLEFRNGNRTVTGFCGDVWTLLSEFLNFT
ncbi:hypothetical protein QAD02_016896 [Eretmocerus hayati]|uniref:Uncharacterized protein n=1 Tax=Eretmocerus hayati TaxID=131215 RepID=A0ACC2PEW0_9HYME|nr:hypothetical protein QAD02_016896 [Eretmocerus hayati]